MVFDPPQVEGQISTYTSQRLTLNPGSHSLSENDLSLFVESNWNCSNGGGGPFNNGTVVLAGKDDVTCTIDNDGRNFGLVVDNSTRDVTFFNSVTNTIIGTTDIGAEGQIAGDCSIALAHGKALVTKFDSQLHVIDLASKSVTNAIAISNAGEDTGLSPDGNFVIVADGIFNAPLSVVDIESESEIGTSNLTGNFYTSIAVCENGMILTSAQSVFKGMMDDLGAITGPFGSINLVVTTHNTICSPTSNFGVAANVTSGLVSFRLSDMTQIDSEASALSFSAAFSPDGKSLFSLRVNGDFRGFAYDPTTGMIGASLFTLSDLFPIQLFGIDQVAAHPDGTKVYVSVSGAVNIYDYTGTLLSQITGPSIVVPTGICFPE